MTKIDSFITLNKVQQLKHYRIMSAFVVSDKTLKRVASIIANVCNDNEPAITGEAAEKIKELFSDCKKDVYKIAARLYKVNVESVNYRYDDNTSTRFSKKNFGTVNPSEFLFEEHRAQSTFQAYTSVSCWIYQSCERPDHNENKYYRAVNILSDSLVNFIGIDSDKIANCEQWNHIMWCE